MRGQRVLAPDGGPEWWTVLDETLAVVDPVDEFLAHLTAIERSPGTVRSYAFDLRDYFDFLGAHRLIGGQYVWNIWADSSAGSD